MGDPAIFSRVSRIAMSQGTSRLSLKSERRSELCLPSFENLARAKAARIPAAGFPKHSD
jgi:hypothetical protein